ncbi:hypothetical protein ACNO8X_08980 [Mycobacterium sp. PDNC021]|uniref:hypothetical protein n=1 Tax=Mycobacterium sp. PDNC021 TaxID=3391399 RepID=UPI003AAA7DFB
MFAQSEERRPIAERMKKGCLLLVAGALVATGATAGSAVPLFGSHQIAVASAEANINVRGGAKWLIVEGLKSVLIDGALNFIVNAKSPNDAKDVLKRVLASAPHFDTVSDPQQIVWQAAPIAGPWNGIIYGNADKLFNSMAAAGQRTGPNSLRNGMYTVTLDRGSRSDSPVFTMTNGLITKRITVLA